MDRSAVDSFFITHRPEYVFLAAAKVGGISANHDFPADFIYQNLVIQNNVIDSAFRNGTKKLLFLGSVCIYPKFAEMPIQESSLLTGLLEPTNEPYAIAKIAGLKTCQAYTKQYGWPTVSLMPTNLYGPGDNFSLTASHVLPALIRKFDDAKLSGAPEVVLWGTGTPRREFLHVSDLASASVFLMKNYDSPDLINVGVDVGCSAEIRFDSSKPDGTPRRKMDNSKLKNLGWRPSFSLEDGIRSTYEWYVQNRASARL
jgi:GDP-L-fucose synthase